VRTIGVEERRDRLARRHRLAPGSAASDPLEVATSLVALHATDPATVHLSIAARTGAADVAPAEAALYDDRTLVRLLGMRRTMWVVPAALVPVVQASSTAEVAAKERKRLIQVIEQAGLAAEGAAWLADAEAATLAALRARGGGQAAEIGAAVPVLREKVVIGGDSKWAVAQNLTTRVLLLLGASGAIVRGRPAGSWTGSRYRWMPADVWFGPDPPELPGTADARAELVRRWLAAFGPATLEDLRWWTGWTLGATRQAVAAVDTVEVGLDGGAAGVVLGDDIEAEPPAGPWVALLPALDPTAMGWKERAWYVGDHTAASFDRSGNIGPTIWCNGRIVGGWAQRKDGTVAHRLLEDVGREAEDAVEAAAARLTAWLGPARVTPRFPTPLQKELARP
jgi:hypothetical protein